MRLFGYRRILHGIELEIFGVKSKFHWYNKNEIISLGTNCFSRAFLTKLKIKPRRKNGELSCPFDLCTTPLNSLIEILESNFSTFFESLVYVESNDTWFNQKYNINFFHDHKLTLETFKSKYQKRIANFQNISQDNKPKKYVLTIFNRDFTIEQLNKIYTLLLSIRENRPFDFIVLSFVDNNSPEIFLNELNQNIKYYEYYVDNVNKFLSEWFLPDYENPELAEKLNQLLIPGFNSNLE